MAEDIEKLRKSVRVNRVLISIIFLLLVLLIAAIGVCGFYAYKISQQMIPIARKFSEIDWTRLYDQATKIDPFELKDTINEVKSQVDSIAQAVESISAALPH